jgi:hemerythrin HHE cation binding domain-containing protein
MLPRIMVNARHKHGRARAWGRYLAGGAAAVAAGGLLLFRRRVRGDGTEGYARFAARLRLGHEALRRNLDHFVELIDRDADGHDPAGHDPAFDIVAFAEFVDLYCDFLIVHHECEDRIIFPALRKHGRLRSTDAAHLDRWGVEHREVNVAGAALARAAASAGGRGRHGLAAVRRLSLELAQLLRPHLASEEEILTADHLAEMIPARALPDIGRASARLSANPRRMALLLAHSLLPEEQQAVFGDAPWIFRRVILPLADRRANSRFAPFAVAATIRV